MSDLAQTPFTKSSNVDLSNVDLSSISPVAPPPLAHVTMSWGEVWSKLVHAKVRFRSTLWANDRCVVLFQQSKSNARQFALTDRELLVLRRTLNGESQKELAATQGLSSSTIGASLKSAMLKLGFPTQRHTLPIAALTWSHDHGHGATRARPPVYAVAHGESVLAATGLVDWNRVPRLTSGEREITRLLIQGKLNSEIAYSRNTSLHTVENQVASLLRKAKAHNRFDLLRTLYAPAPTLD
jgi:DNA-binding CsgD family transcriptional regulator